MFRIVSMRLVAVVVFAALGCGPTPAPVTAAQGSDGNGPSDDNAPAASVDAAPALVTCVLPWTHGVGHPVANGGLPVLDGKHFRTRVGVCGVVQITFTKWEHYQWGKPRLAQVIKKFVDGDPTLKVTFEFGEKPIAIYRTREQLLANPKIPADLIPKGFDFATQVLVETRYGHSPVHECRDGMLGLTMKQGRARAIAMNKWRARAQALATQWAFFATPEIGDLEGFTLIRKIQPLLNDGPHQIMCTTTFIWQQALVVVDKSAVSIRMLY